MGTDRIGDWIQTFSGIAAYPLDLRQEEVELEDIAHSLSHICRYNGHVVTFYSVAEHSVRVCDAASQRAKPYALFHDASEAYMCDIPRPLKHYLNGYKEAEMAAMRVIIEKFDLDASEDVVEEVDQLDRRIVMDEKSQLLRPGQKWRTDERSLTPLGIRILPMSSDVAKRAFISTAQKLLAPWL